MPPWGVVFFLAAFIFYLVTLAPGVLDHDGAQFQTLGYTGGVAHPTGYPLYIMILRTFVCCLPIGDVAFRVNLVSAVFASLTVMLVYYFCFLTLRNHLASLVAAISLGVSSTFWIYGITAEVYSLHLFFMMCILVVLLWWKQTQKPQLLWLLSFLLGVSFSHHRMTLLLIPSVLYFVLAYWKKENRVNLLRMSLVVAILFIVGLSVYLYSYHQISIDNPANEYQVLTQYLPQLGITEADWNSTWKKFLCLISTGRYKWDILVFTTPRFVENLAAVVPNLLHQFALGVVVGMVGLIISFLKDRRLAWFLFSLFGIHILFALVVHGEFQVWLLPGNV
ncbi:MAG: DUF2723 domain-containing protein, partial [candidate division KSB1 bacterium]|nr:DUF2723 domain-containing protein [candidate division KSB1 bacterium]